MTRFIVLRCLVAEENKIILEGLTGINQKPSGVMATWINFFEATTNYTEPEKCDLLSFEDKEELEENLELWELVGDNVTILGVDSDKNVNSHEFKEN